MSVWRPFLRGPLVRAALGLVGLLGLAAVLAPWIAPHDPNAVELARKLEPPSGQHLLGTDHLGRDLLSRLIWGARLSLGTVAVIVGLILVLSLAIGGVSGLLGGWVDAVCMRTCDVFLTFPTFVLALFLIGVLGTGLVNVVLAIVLTHWAWYARIVRGLVLGLRHRGFILAARVAGTSRWRIALRHVLPPVAAQLLILATLDIGHMMLHVSGLSFLGLGVQPPTPEWGVMISDARQYLWTQPALILYPGGLIFLTVLAFNIPGDALRDALDPVVRAQLA
jgi:nickel transport system permease protein